jgi:hypothetical protein
MSKIPRLVLVLFLLAPAFVWAQSFFLIQNRYRSSKKRKLKPNWEYTIKTNETIYHHKKLVGVTDTSIKITIDVPTSDLEMWIQRYPNPNANDTTYSVKSRKDTIDIAFRKMFYLERHLFRKREWTEPFYYFALGGVGAIALSPIVALADGPGAGLGCLRVGAILICITVPIIFISTRKVKYDMNDWLFIRTSPRSAKRN